MNEENNEDIQISKESAPVKPKRFGRGIYDKADVPIKLLDRFIAFIIIAIFILILVFAINGGYTISFDTQGGSELAPQKLNYGEFVKEPEKPVKPGYDFEGWYYEQDADHNWNFSENKVGGDMMLIARWKPAEVTVKFDADGGKLDTGKVSKNVIYNDKYGELPIPGKEGCTFEGWLYSGEIITSDSTVIMPGEHILTALWKK